MTTIQQLSVFLENREGKLYEVLEAIGAAGINIIASTVSDTAEYGLFRLITNDNERAFSLLKAKGIGVHLTPVIALSIDSMPGSLAAKIKGFSLAGLNIQYLYSVSVGGKAFIILKFKMVHFKLSHFYLF